MIKGYDFETDSDGITSNSECVPPTYMRSTLAHFHPQAAMISTP